MKNILISIAMLIFSQAAFAQGWQVRQVKINHIQAGNGEMIFISFSQDIKELSGCGASWGNNWGAIPLDTMTEKKKFLISFAMSAQASGTLVDVGGTRGDCASGFGDLGILTFIRVGDHLNP